MRECQSTRRSLKVMGASSIIIMLHIEVNGTLVTPQNIIVDKPNPMLFVAAVMCAVAICVCLYTLILFVTMEPQRVIPQQNREMSSDYETMMPAVISEVHCGDSSLEPIAPSDAPKDLTAENQESGGCLGLSEYLDLELSQVEEHVYCDLHGKKIPLQKHLGH